MTDEELRALVRQVVVEVVRQAEAAPGKAAPGAPAVRVARAPSAARPAASVSEPTALPSAVAAAAPAAGSLPSAAPVAPVAPAAAAPGTAAPPAGDAAPVPWRRGPRHRPLPPPWDPALLERLVGTTPARIATGRTGARYLTESYLGLRADHAIALDAVESEVEPAWAEAQGWVALRTQATDHQDFLLHPEHGRRLDEASRARAAQAAAKGVDVQLIAGDGLSAAALEENGPPLMKALEEALKAAGFTVGPVLFVKFARIGVQDELGVLTQARATLIVVGERPGLGTGDSLSIYTAFGPRLGQDNAEKDCISNVRGVGFTPARAAARCAELFKRTFAAGGGGVKLTGGDPAFRPHVRND